MRKLFIGWVYDAKIRGPMIRGMLALSLSLTILSFAEDRDDVSVIITNYYYDEWGRPIRSSQQVPNYSNYPYNNPYNYPYTPSSLPGADPDRFEEIFEQNSRK